MKQRGPNTWQPVLVLFRCYLLVMPVQLSLPGSARASATNSGSEPIFNDADTPTPASVLVTRAIGTRSRGSYGSLSWRNGCAVNADVGANRNVWSSRAPTKAPMATNPSPPGRFSTTTG